MHSFLAAVVSNLARGTACSESKMLQASEKEQGVTNRMFDCRQNGEKREIGLFSGTKKEPGTQQKAFLDLFL